MKSKSLRKVRGEHCLNIFVSYELKNRLKVLSERYDRTVADMVRSLLKIGIPIMEGISKAEERMMKEYIQLFRKFRQIKNLKEI
jgi:predicted DNA-binding protein